MISEKREVGFLSKKGTRGSKFFTDCDPCRSMKRRILQHLIEDLFAEEES